ncbi:hypothetical protein BW13_06905 [Bifidobacterium sp. UTCIF-37]|uniref:hypothetical protein n=1 Tax=unclassified Bifidobacterium TaxID=2608897 RepID=UPI00112C1613|nr:MULTISPECIES: hypothetical protein [unclassified Bifidobacterium]TPF86215.1 hypothetical protein BW13_06905 [Bifidobacterium sp. UTCIF-37]TPF88423.1 hypothetical protein BW11_07370 [Bifidobacterium sp. UTCIF-38]
MVDAVTRYAVTYWRLTDLPVGGTTVDIYYYYDLLGDRYGHGSGLTVLIDGRTLHDDSDHPSITVSLPAYVQ